MNSLAMQQIFLSWISLMIGSWSGKTYLVETESGRQEGKNDYSDLESVPEIFSRKNLNNGNETQLQDSRSDNRNRKCPKEEPKPGRPCNFHGNCGYGEYCCCGQKDNCMSTSRILCRGKK